MTREEIRKGDIIRIDGWLINSVDDCVWYHPRSQSQPALRLTGWRVIDGKSSYGSSTVLWREDTIDIELLARDRPKSSPNAFEIYEKLRVEDP